MQVSWSVTWSTWSVLSIQQTVDNLVVRLLFDDYMILFHFSRQATIRTYDGINQIMQHKTENCDLKPPKPKSMEDISWNRGIIYQQDFS